MFSSEKSHSFISLHHGARIAVAFAIIGLSSSCSESGNEDGDAPMTVADTKTGYAQLDGLNLYYEIHGSGGKPLVLLHGAYIDGLLAFGSMLPRLSEDRQVIIADLQGHGRTADVDRSLSYEQMADDINALLVSLDISSADVFGYSMGGGVALQLALRQPHVVNKLILASTAYRLDGWHPEILALIAQTTPEQMAETPYAKEYAKVAPRPEDFANLVTKLTRLDTEPFAWSEEAIKALPQPTMVIAGDADAVLPEHVLSLFKLRGGGVPGDAVGVPKAWLTIFPGTTHAAVLERPELPNVVISFLDEPVK